MCGFFTRIIATHASILISGTSSKADASPSQACGTLSYHLITQVHGFGEMLRPTKFSAQDHLTSELLRFL